MGAVVVPTLTPSLTDDISDTYEFFMAQNFWNGKIIKSHQPTNTNNKADRRRRLNVIIVPPKPITVKTANSANVFFQLMQASFQVLF